jgi:hypothetical protein
MRRGFFLKFRAVTARERKKKTAILSFLRSRVQPCSNEWANPEFPPINVVLFLYSHKEKEPKRRCALSLDPPSADSPVLLDPAESLKTRPALQILMGGTQTVQAPVSAGSAVLGCGTMGKGKPLNITLLFLGCFLKVVCWAGINPAPTPSL